MFQHTHMRVGATLAGALAAGLVLAGPAAAQNVKIGSLSAITGPIANLVPPIVDAEQHAVTVINEGGGILGRDAELVVGDTQCAAQAAVDAAQKLVNVDQVVAVAGALCSGATLAAAQSVAIPAGVVMVSPASTSPEITGLMDNDLLFRVAPSDAYQGEVLARYVLGKGLNKVALTFINNDYGVGLAGAFRDAFNAGGGVITSDQVHEPNKSSYRSELATLATDNPQALVLLAYAGDSGLAMVRQSLENDFFDKFVGADGMRDDVLIEQIGAANLDILITQPTSAPINPAKEVFDASFAAAGGDPSSIFVQQSFDAVFMLGLAIQKAGSTDRAAVRAALRDIASPPGMVVGPGDWAKAVEALAAGQAINYEGAGGSHDFDDQGDVAGVIGEYAIKGNTFAEVGLID